MESTNTSETNRYEVSPVATRVVTAVICFLKLFVCETLAKRVVSMVLIAVGVPNAGVTALTGLCDKSVRVLRKAVLAGETDGLFNIGGGGRPGKLKDVEAAIIAEIDANDYHSCQQIADMILEKFKIKVSDESVRRLLKKTKSSG